MIFVDTNVVSETFRAQPEPRVLDWLVWHDSELAMPSIVVADDLPAVLPADPGRLAQVLDLLLGNALKFGTPGVVQVRAGWTAVPPQLQLEVADSGPGIRPDVQPHLFEPLRPGDESNTRAHGGLGLGLATAQRLVRSLDGRITVDSQPGAGTTFRVVLPAGWAGA